MNNALTGPAPHEPPLLDEAPRRVVSLVPSVTESLINLDLGDRLVAVTDACARLIGALDHLPRVGSPGTPDFDRIMALAPDLVILSADANPPHAADSLQDAGLPVWVTGPRSVFEVLNLLWDLMQVFEHAVMGPRVQAIERAYDATLAASRTVPPVVVFAPLGRAPWRTFGRDTYPHDLLRVCGGENAYPDPPADGDSGLTLDAIIRSQPDVVLLPGAPGPFDEDDIALFAALDIPAAHTGRIYLIDATLLTWPGTRAAYALRDLPGLLMPQPTE